MGAFKKIGSMIGNLTGFGISLTDATEQWVPSNQTLNFSHYQGKKLRDRIFMVSVIYAGGFGGFDETDLQNLLKAYEEKSPVEITMPRHFFEGTLVISITAEHKTKNETLKMDEYTKLSAREQQEDYYLVVEYGVAIQGVQQYVMNMSGRADNQSEWMKRFEDCYFKLMHLMCGMKRNPDVKDIVKKIPEYKGGTWPNFTLTGNIGGEEWAIGAGPINITAEVLEALAKDPIRGLEFSDNVEAIIQVYTALGNSLNELMMKGNRDVIDVKKKTFVQCLKQAAVEIEQKDPVGRKGYADNIAKMLDDKMAELDTHKEMTDEQKEAYIDKLLSRLGKYDALLKAARRLMEKQPTTKDSNSGDGADDKPSKFADQRAAVIQQYEEDQKEYGDKATALTPAGWGTGPLASYAEYLADRKKGGPLEKLERRNVTLFEIAIEYAKSISDERLQAGDPVVAKYLVGLCDAEKRRINGNTSE